LTGRPAHLIVIDDPIRDAAEARSETVRRGILDWYRQVALTRQQPGAALVLIQTRWHLDDLIGSLLREQANDESRLLSFAALDAEGRALWPERYDRNWLLRQQRQMGVDAFSALYMQNPVSVETQIFKPHLWRYYDVAPQRIAGTCVIAVDPWAGVGRDNAAFVVMRGNADGLFILEMQANNRWQLHEQKQILEQLAERYQPSIVLVETEATTGADLVSEFRRGTLLLIKGVKTEGRDKLFRAQLLEYLLIDRKVYLPREADWLQAWLEESAQFPVGKSDDRVDAYCYGAAWLRDRYSNGWSSGVGSVIQTCSKPIACGSELRAISGSESLPDPSAGSWESPRNWRL
jgi:predicted phage terminase large subunit-like protein